jgi:hypothetical protein
MEKGDRPMKDDDKAIGWDWGLLLVAILWVASYFLGRVVTESDTLPVALKVAVALLPVVPFAIFVYLVWKCQSGMDELQLRVQVQALAIAYPLSILFLMVFGLMGEALDLTLERHVWFYLPIFYFVGLVLASRRYQ